MGDFDARGLPPASAEKPYHLYQVTKPLPTERAVVAPWFGAVGRGVQYTFDQSISDLIKGGYLTEVSR
ncbi:TNT domain-containing protein [Actinacidiphila epipremni]|uniref:TNT domain-containing protein n=1 Tax=Actinacidiphila epipremni TaxID=2053013 RepID=A0ABX0ZKQ2_9ACTN|nr:TNT domain-containing protein [Actinacidiphila epipremni]NJP43402.1 TNT domain-containing protein [Actinacidiphila epipremni]